MARPPHIPDIINVRATLVIEWRLFGQALDCLETGGAQRRKIARDD